jgi:hypothetical protein
MFLILSSGVVLAIIAFKPVSSFVCSQPHHR